jgi:hydrogenase maturation factor
VAVFSAAQIAKLRKLKPDMDVRFFAETGTTQEDEGGIIIAEDSEEEGEVNVEDI